MQKKVTISVTIIVIGNIPIITSPHGIVCYRGFKINKYIKWNASGQSANGFTCQSREGWGEGLAMVLALGWT